MPAVRVADETRAWNMLGAVACSVVSAKQIIHRADRQSGCGDTLQFVARQGGGDCGIVEQTEPSRADGEDVIYSLCDPRLFIGARSFDKGGRGSEDRA